MRLVANCRREVDHGVDSPQCLALEVAVAKPREIAKRDLHVHPVPPEAPGIPHQGSNVVATGQ
jgi:hypothetical protein